MKSIDLFGKKFGVLRVTKRAPNDRHGKKNWYCRCECGNTIRVRQDNLTAGRTQSCGCGNKSGDIIRDPHVIPDPRSIAETPPRLPIPANLLPEPHDPFPGMTLLTTPYNPKDPFDESKG